MLYDTRPVPQPLCAFSKSAWKFPWTPAGPCLSPREGSLNLNPPLHPAQNPPKRTLPCKQMSGFTTWHIHSVGRRQPLHQLPELQPKAQIQEPEAPHPIHGDPLGLKHGYPHWTRTLELCSALGSLYPRKHTLPPQPRSQVTSSGQSSHLSQPG